MNYTSSCHGYLRLHLVWACIEVCRSCEGLLTKLHVSMLKLYSIYDTISLSFPLFFFSL